MPRYAGKGQRAYDLIRTVMAQAAARHGIEPRSVTFTGAMHTLAAFEPLLERRTTRGHRGPLAAMP